MHAGRSAVRSLLAAAAAAVVVLSAGSASARPGGPATRVTAVAAAIGAQAGGLPSSGGIRLPGKQGLLDVSCPAASLCMGVGEADGDPFSSPFSQIWNGRAWRTLRTPEQQPDSVLNAVSCPSATRCIAIGNTNQTGVAFADEWDGKTWRTLPPLAAPAFHAALGLSCVTASRCVAVGGSDRNLGSPSPTIAESWNGKAWSRMTPAVPPGATAAGFSGVSCVRAMTCMAVGRFITGTGSSQQIHPLAESWDGSTWTLLTAPAGPAVLGGVSCASASACMVLGGGFSMFTAAWDGSSWTNLSAPSPAGSQFPSLNDVSCASATSCIAVGAANNAAGGFGPFAEEWQGGASWTLRTVPDPFAGAFDRHEGLSRVSCPGPSRCMATGGRLAASWNGTRWRVLRTERFDALWSLSCPRVRWCLAVGEYLNGSDITQALAQVWNGRTWRPASPPGLLGSLTDVTCLSASFCLAAGRGDADGGNPLAETWNGTRWKPVPIPQGNAGIDQISCLSRVLCLALAPGRTPGAEIWRGRAWRDAAPPAVPPAATGSAFFGLSCTRPAFCMAVGFYTLDQHQDVPSTLADVWNGTRWHTVHSPDPGGNSGFHAVACVIRAGCMAVGSIGSGAANLAARWNGRTWRVLKMPRVPGGPADISCPSIASCMGVSTYIVIGLHTQLEFGRAMAWNGKTWRVTRLAGPGGALADVSCGRPARCIAVGFTTGRTLAERWNGSTWQLLKPLSP